MSPFAGGASSNSGTGGSSSVRSPFYHSQVSPWSGIAKRFVGRKLVDGSLSRTEAHQRPKPYQRKPVLPSSITTATSTDLNSVTHMSICPFSQDRRKHKRQAPGSSNTVSPFGFGGSVPVTTRMHWAFITISETSETVVDPLPVPAPHRVPFNRSCPISTKTWKNFKCRKRLRLINGKRFKNP